MRAVRTVKGQRLRQSGAQGTEGTPYLSVVSNTMLCQSAPVLCKVQRPWLYLEQVPKRYPGSIPRPCDTHRLLPGFISKQHCPWLLTVRVDLNQHDGLTAR